MILIIFENLEFNEKNEMKGTNEKKKERNIFLKKKLIYYI